MEQVDGSQAFLHSLLEHEVLFSWSPRYNLGIPVVDEQHRGIVTTINSLHFAIEHGQGIIMLEPVVKMVSAYTLVHFDTEESFFKACDFPYLEEHQELHNVLRQRLSAIGEKSLNEQNPLEFLNFLKNWFVDHICEKDRMFKEFLMEMARM